MQVLAALILSIPPAVSTLAVLVFVFGIIQILKQSSVLAPYITGWWSIALNAVLSALGLLVVIPPAQLYDPMTLGVTFTTWLGIVLGAAGIHGTYKSMSPPSVLATLPGSAKVVTVPATLVPDNPAATAVDPVKKTLVLLLVTVLVAGLVGCPANLPQRQQIAQAANTVSVITLDFQTGEIAAHNSGLIPDADHVFIQEQLLSVAALGKTTDGCILAAVDTTTTLVCIKNEMGTIDKINANGGLYLKSDKAKTTFAIAMLGARTALDSIYITLGGK